MEGQVVEPTDSTPYLGVTLNNKLQWNHHIEKTTSAANRMLGFLCRTLHKCPQELKEKAYKSTVRPKLEYCASIWDPHQQKYVERIEMVQRRAARFVKNKPHRHSGPQHSVTAMLQELGWESLQDRRTNSRTTLLYKVHNHLVDVPAEYHPVPLQQRRKSRRHSCQFQRYQASVDNFKYAFLPRTIVDWNNLPPEVVAAESLDLFKKRLSAQN